MASAARPLILRCKSKSGQHTLDLLTDDSTVDDLQAVLFSLFSIPPHSLRVLSGFPPRPLNLSNSDQRLGTLFPQSKESLIIEECSEKIGMSMVCVCHHVFANYCISNRQPKVNASHTKYGLTIY